MIKRNMTLIVGNQFLTVLADSIFDLAILWYVYQITESALYASTVTAITTLTTVLIAPLVGIFVDRTKPKTAMQIGYAVMIFIGILLAISYFYRIESIMAVIYVAIIIQHICMFLIGPAKNKLLPRIVGEERIIKVNGYIISSSETSGLIGKSISGVIIGLIGFIGVMLFHSAVYLVASILLFFVVSINGKGLAISKNPSAKPSLVREFIEGLKVLKTNKPIFKLVLIASAVNMSTIAGSLVVVLVNDQYGVGPVHYGILHSVGAGAGILIGLFADQIVRRFRMNLTFFLCLAACGIGFIGMGLTSKFYVGLLFFLLMISGSIVVNILFSSLIILLVEDEYRGRVFTTTAAFASMLMPPLAILGGYLADVTDILFIYLFAGIWNILWGIVPLIDRDIRDIQLPVKKVEGH